jgi:Uma2 family endonuclease
LESHWHVLQIALLIEVVTHHLQGRDDYYAGGNMFLYYSEEQARNRDYRGPDFFYVNGANRLPMRPYWAVWQEGGRYPDVIVELLSPTTAEEDRTTKRALYERVFRTREYFCYDPESQELEGWRIGTRGRYRTIKANDKGWRWVEELGLWLGTWRGKYQEYDQVWLRFYNKQGRLVPTGREAEARRAKTQARRAEAAEAEVARLKERLAALEQQKEAKDNRGT